MIGMLFKVVVGTLVVICITAGLGLVIMAGVAATHGVERVDVPSNSFLAGVAQNADYADAYRMKMEFVFYRDIHQVIENAEIKGDDEAHRSKHEVVYDGGAPGLRYQVAYLLDRGVSPPTLTMITTVDIREKKGEYFWMVVRPIHRCLAPYMLDRLVSRAPN